MTRRSAAGSAADVGDRRIDAADRAARAGATTIDTGSERADALLHMPARAEAAERRAAAVAVCARARSRAEAVRLLSMLGLP